MFRTGAKIYLSEKNWGLGTFEFTHFHSVWYCIVFLEKGIEKEKGRKRSTTLNLNDCE